MTESSSMPLLLAVDGTTIALAIGGLVVGAVLALLGNRAFTGRTVAAARQEAASLTREAETEARGITERAELDAERRNTERRAEFDREIAAGLAEIKESQSRAAKREETLDRKLERINERESKLEAREETMRSDEERIAARAEETDRILEALSGGPFIFNLGHGIVPQTPPEHVTALLKQIRG